MSHEFVWSFGHWPNQTYNIASNDSKIYQSGTFGLLKGITLITKEITLTKEEIRRDMDARIYITLLVFTQLNWIYSMTISGSVSDDVEFIYKTFPVQSSMGASIEVDVYYPHNSSTPYPILGIYTTRDHVNVKVKCAFKRYGQLGNYNLHPGITMDLYESEPLNCHVDNTINTIHCTGKDFKPRHFSFSFGFQCFNCFSCSLRGLSYNLKIYGQTNETHCLAMSPRTANTCYTYSQYGVFPNLLGHMNIDIDPRDFKFECLDHVIPFICYVYLPKCDPVSKQVIHPCREMCHDYLNTCGNILGEIRDCNYLPSSNGDIPCIHHLVRCTAPPIVENATVVSTNDTAEYSCSEGFTLVGNKTVTCKSLRLWSAPPQCLLIEGKSKPSPDTKSGSTLFVSVLTALLSVYLLIILIIIIVVICKIRSKARRIHGVNGDQMQADMELNEIDEPLRHLATNEAHLKRNREFDAFVLYHFDSDNDFVMNDLVSN